MILKSNGEIKSFKPTENPIIEFKLNDWFEKCQMGVNLIKCDTFDVKNGNWHVTFINLLSWFTLKIRLMNQN